MLIPLYVLIGVWGGPGRFGATFKFVAYTIAGSLFMLVAIIAAGLGAGTFDMTQLAGQGTSTWIFLGFAVAFAVKAPLWPFHGWLPDAYRESPPEVSAVLSGVISKAGAYGFLAIAIPFYPGPASDWRTPGLVLSSIGLVYASLLAFRAPDVRGVIAYSSLAQMNLILIGIFAANSSGYTGALLQMVNHGLISAALFLLAGAIERRTTTGELARLGGMARGRPVLATILIATGVIALAVPGSTAFAGEFLVLNGVFDVGWGWAVVGAVAMVLAAMYMLRLISAVLHENVGPAVPAEALDLRPAEIGVIAPSSSSCSRSPSGRRRSPSASRELCSSGVHGADDRLVRPLADPDHARRRDRRPAREPLPARRSSPRVRVRRRGDLLRGRGGSCDRALRGGRDRPQHRLGRDAPRSPGRVRPGADHGCRAPHRRRLLP